MSQSIWILGATGYAGVPFRALARNALDYDEVYGSLRLLIDDLGKTPSADYLRVLLED